MKVALVLGPRNLGENPRKLLREMEQAGLEEVWVTEELFNTSAPVSAAFVLGATERLRVGMGIMTTALRDPAVTALEIANLETFWPGRLIAGLGHGAARPLAEVNSTRSPQAFPEELREICSRLRASPGRSPEVLAAAGTERSRDTIRDIVDGFIISWMTPTALVQDFGEWAVRQEPTTPMSLMSLFTLRSERAEALTLSKGVVASLLATARKASFESTRHESEVRSLVAGMQPSDDLVNDLSVTGDFDAVQERLRTLNEMAGLDRVILYPSSGTDIDLLVEALPRIIHFDRD